MGGYGSNSAAAWNSQTPQPAASTNDLESQAASGPSQVGQMFQQQQEQQQQPQQQGGFSAGNPYLPLIQYHQQEVDANAPKQVPGGTVKGILTNFFSGMGNTLLTEAGQPNQNQKYQQAQTNLRLAIQGGNQWEDMQGTMRYRDAMIQKMQADTDFENRIRPGQEILQQQQIQEGQQRLSTVQPVYTKDQLVAQGLPDFVAAQFAGKPLTQADEAIVSQNRQAYAAQNQLQSLDYGVDGTGPNKGRWWVNAVTKQPVSQYSSTSEAGSALNLAKYQAQQQNNLLKGLAQPVYAYDPKQNATVLTTMTDARQGGMQNIRGVKQTDISKDEHDTRVLNDVAVKANAVMDASAAMDTWNPAQMKAMQGVLDAANKDSQLEVGAFGARFPTSWWNTLATVSQQSMLSQQQRNYVVAVASLRESAMGLNRVLTGSARANESQITALMQTIPGLETDSGMVRQKLGAFTQNVDMLRQGIPRMAGIDVIPVKQWSGPQTSVQQSTSGQPQQQTNRGTNQPTGWSKTLGSWELKILGLD